MDTEDQRYERARARAKELRDLYTHATVYVLVNIGLFVINVLTGRGVVVLLAAPGLGDRVGDTRLERVRLRRWTFRP